MSLDAGGIGGFRDVSQGVNLGLSLGPPKVCVHLDGWVLLQGWQWGKQVPDGPPSYSQYRSFTCASV